MCVLSPLEAASSLSPTVASNSLRLQDLRQVTCGGGNLFSCFYVTKTHTSATITMLTIKYVLNKNQTEIAKSNIVVDENLSPALLYCPSYRVKSENGAKV